MASKYGHVEVVKKLLSHPQVDVNQEATIGKQNPLWIASYYGHVEVVRALLSHPDIDVNIKPTIHLETGTYV